MIAIIDYGLGNLGSIQNMLNRLNVDSMITSDKSEIKYADKLILPGVGAFDKGISNLQKLDLIDLLNYQVLIKKKWILGICLGMQLFTEGSEEGNLKGLGWIQGRTVKFNFKDTRYKIPHMGWNSIKIKKENPIFKEDKSELRFYFVHSYYVKCQNEDDVVAETTYGINFTAALQHENVFASQFHPEKSHKFGLEVLLNFSSL